MFDFFCKSLMHITLDKGLQLPIVFYNFEFLGTMNGICKCILQPTSDTLVFLFKKFKI